LFPVWQQVDGTSLLQLDEDRAVAVPFAEGEVVDAQHLGSGSDERTLPAQLLEERVRTDGQSQTSCHIGARFLTEGMAAELEGLRQADGPPGVALHEARQALGEDAAGAGALVAEELAAPNPQANLDAVPGQVGHGLGVATMNSLRRAAAVRAGHLGADGGDHSRIASASGA